MVKNIVRIGKSKALTADGFADTKTWTWSRSASIAIRVMPACSQARDMADFSVFTTSSRKMFRRYFAVQIK